jgi:hypothetical protein
LPKKVEGLDGKMYPIRPPEARAKPKGLTPPPTRYVRDEWSQDAPDEPAISYDEPERPTVDLAELMAEARAKAAEMQQRDLGVPSVPDSYDAEKETAIQIAAQLESEAFELTELATAIQGIRGIRSFYRLEPQRLAALDITLSQTMVELEKAWNHLQGLRVKIDVIQRTGEPYGDEEDDQ